MILHVIFTIPYKDGSFDFLGDWRFVLGKEIAEKLMKPERWQVWVEHRKLLIIKTVKEWLGPGITKGTWAIKGRERRELLELLFFWITCLTNIICYLLYTYIRKLLPLQRQSERIRAEPGCSCPTEEEETEARHSESRIPPSAGKGRAQRRIVSAGNSQFS